MNKTLGKVTPTRLRAPFLKISQKNLLLQALTALIGDQEDGEAIAWATDQEKSELAAIRSEFERFYGREAI